jgi:hypothetical protein
MPVVDQFQETFRESESPVRAITVTSHPKLSLSNSIALRVGTDHESAGESKAGNSWSPRLIAKKLRIDHGNFLICKLRNCVRDKKSWHCKAI